MKKIKLLAKRKIQEFIHFIYIHSAALSPDQQRRIYFLSHKYNVLFILYPAPEEICYFTPRAKKSISKFNVQEFRMCTL